MMNFIVRVFKKLFTVIGDHKVVSAFVILVLGGAGYWWFVVANQKQAQAQYVTAPVTRGPLVVAVSGSGQVSSANQLDVKAKVSGDVLTVSTRAGQSVSAGATLVVLDSREAEKAVRDAESNLESAKLSFEKLKQSSADVGKLLEDAFGDISSTFLDLPDVVSTAEDIILGKTVNPGAQDNKGYYRDFVRSDDSTNYQKNDLFITSAEADFRAARKQYDVVLITYKNTKLGAQPEALRTLLDETVMTVKILAQALKSEQNLFDFLADYAATYNKTLSPAITSYKSDLRTYIGQVNGHLAALTSAQSSVENAPLDIASQELAVKQRENALADAREELVDYVVRAPFTGIIAVMDIDRGDSVSSGGTVATLIAPQRIAEISLNEVDAANITIGQKANIAFDALPELKAEGTISAIDTLGTVSQGVVNYTVKITFDVADERVKPGMSVSASITTATKEGVLMVPNAAVKAEGDLMYVEVLDVSGAIVGDEQFPRQSVSSTRPFSSSTPSSGMVFGGGRRRGSSTTAVGAEQATSLRRIPVTVGLANDTMTEIILGITEGQQVVTRTVQNGGTAATQTQNQTQQRGFFGVPGGGGGGFIRR